ESLSLFAAGRTEEQRGNYSAALRLYQRALQHEPRSLPILKQVIEVARGLNRKAEYMRYALLAVELDPSDMHLLTELTRRLIDQNDFENALRLFERGREMSAKDSVPYLTMTMQIGRLAYITGRNEQAAVAFAEVMQAVENPARLKLDAADVKSVLGTESRTYEMMGEAFLSAGRADEALQAFEKAQHALPDKAGFAFNRAQVFARKKQSAQAIQQLQIYFDSKETSEDLSPYQLLSTVLESDNRKSELIGRLEQVFAADSQNVPLGYYLAIQYRFDNQFAKAEPIYQDLLKRAPKLEAYRGLIDVYRHMRQAAPLLKLLGELAAKSGTLESVERETKAIAADGPLLDEMIPLAKAKSQGRDDASFGSNLAMATVAMEAKRYDLAQEFFDAAASSRARATPAVLLTWGLGLLGAGENERAVSVFRRAVDQHVAPSDDPIFHLYLAICLEMCGRTDEALRAGHLAAKISDDSPRVLNRVAWILYHSKRYAAAEQAYREFIAKFDSDFKDEDVRELLKEARLVLSNVCVILHQLPQAEEWLEQVLDEYPDDVGALNDLGYLWADSGKHLDRALKMIRQAVAADPKNYAYRDSLGWVFYRLGRYREAVDELKQAAADPGVDGVVLDHLGDAYFGADQHPQARETWQRAIETLKKQGEQEKARAIEAKLQNK
ncbi:MAG TPA: tetratricopeptide repeat protein, partial [Pirellulales bacterium]|nr:tetratricopeptide repeat protein [Pirellulales bacterium]